MRSAVMVVAALLIGGCSTDLESEQPEPVIASASSHVENVENVTYPLFSFWATPGQVDVFQRAKVILDQHCVNHYGLNVDRPNVDPPPAGYMWTRYGLASYHDAEATGYRIPTSASPAGPQRRTPADRDLYQNETAVKIYLGELAQFGGKKVPEGGCQPWVFAQLGWTSDDNLVEDLLQESMHRSASDSRVQALITEWNKCMKRAGYDFDTPMAAMQHWRSKGMRGDVTQQEITQAVADMRCKDETSLLDTWVAVDIGYQQMLIEEHMQELEEIKAAYAEQERRALAVLAGDLPPVETN